MGFPTLDESTHGHGKKELVVIVGGTGVGKSLILGQIGINVAKSRKKVLLASQVARLRVVDEDDVHQRQRLLEGFELVVDPIVHRVRGDQGGPSDLPEDVPLEVVVARSEDLAHSPCAETLEELGIGRPSTYASILSTILLP
jgi:reverse gyrase